MKYTCKKCEHKWLARIETLPRSCPNCKSYAWSGLTVDFVTADTLEVKE